MEPKFGPEDWVDNGDDDDDGEDSGTNPFNICRLEIRACFWDVVDTLAGELDVDRDTAFKAAVSLFQDFAQTLKPSLRQEGRRARPNAERDAKLLEEYEAAQKGKKSKILGRYARLIGKRDKSGPAARETMKALLHRIRKRRKEDEEKAKERKKMLRRRDKAARG